MPHCFCISASNFLRSKCIAMQSSNVCFCLHCNEVICENCAFLSSCLVAAAANLEKWASFMHLFKNTIPNISISWSPAHQTAQVSGGGLMFSLAAFLVDQREEVDWRGRWRGSLGPRRPAPGPWSWQMWWEWSLRRARGAVWPCPAPQPASGSGCRGWRIRGRAGGCGLQRESWSR